MIYLDGHSTTPMDPSVFEAMRPYFLERFGSASQGLHRYNWEAQAAVLQARERLAHCLGVHEKEIVFTSGASESNHMALLGLAGTLGAQRRTRILSIEIEHSSVLGALQLLSEQGFQIEWLRLTPEGRVNLEDLRAKLAPDVGLVSIALANHEIGVIQDLKAISDRAHEQGALIHCDAVQAFGKIPFTADSIGADLISLSAHKVYGPKGVGALFIRRKNPRVELEPVMLGGGQERGLRPGTLNVPGIVGFGAAVELVSKNLDQEAARLRDLRDLLWNELNSSLRCLVRNTPLEGVLPNNLNVSVDGVDGSALFGRLKEVATSNASACLNGTQDYSQVLTVLGMSKERARATLRIGIGRFNTRDEILRAAQEITTVVKELRKMEKEFAEQTGIPYPAGGCSS